MTLEQQIMFLAFNDELEKIATMQALESAFNATRRYATRAKEGVGRFIGKVIEDLPPGPAYRPPDTDELRFRAEIARSRAYDKMVEKRRKKFDRKKMRFRYRAR